MFYYVSKKGSWYLSHWRIKSPNMDQLQLFIEYVQRSLGFELLYFRRYIE